MKKALLTIAIVLLAVAAQAQIKVHNDGHVSIGTLQDGWDKCTQLYPSGRVHFNTQDTIPWHWVTVATPGVLTGKCWIVTPPDDKYDHRFFVTGEGYVYHLGHYKKADENSMENVGGIVNAGAVLDSITGSWYIPIQGKGGVKAEEQRCAGVTAQNVKKVLPEAVTADENGLLYVDYDALTVFLIEAVKDQRREIELMRKTLEENGLMEPEKP
ncbi:MAG: hypothetical protein IKS53_04580 [Bacteroidales bacterium]|nr:hypothetical protein [Bacteroidales bacterium]